MIQSLLLRGLRDFFSKDCDIPAVVLGGIIVVFLIASHLLGVVWNSLPILLSVLGIFVSFAWFVANAERFVLAYKDSQKTDALSMNMTFSAIIWVISIIFTCVTWSSAHPGPPGPPPVPAQTSCAGHGGVMPNGVHPNKSYESKTDVNCVDGSGFTRD